MKVLKKISAFGWFCLLACSLAMAADQKNQNSSESAVADKNKSGDVEYWSKIAQESPQKNSETKTVTNLWLQKYSDLKAGKLTPPAPKILEVKQPLAPNSNVNVVSVASGTDKTSSTVAADELFLGEYHAAWTEALFPGAGAPSAIGVSWSPGFGFPGTWVPPFSGPLYSPGPVFSSRHPSLGSHPLGGHIIAHQSHGLGSPEFLGGSAIFTDANFGGGGPWGTFAGTPVALTFFFGGVAGYLDYPNCILDDWAGNPGPPGFGAAYFTYTGFVDGDGDPNFDGHFFNDPADVSPILFNYSNTLAFPFLYPAISPPIPVSNPCPPSNALQSDMAVVAPPGGLLPPGALYVAWTGANVIGAPPLVGPPPEGMAFLPTVVFIDASPAPGVGAPFGAIPGAGGFNVLVSPIIAPIGPIIGGGTLAMSTVTVAVNNATYPNPCGPGAVYVAWADAAFGDPDIWFSASFAGGAPGSWTPPVRVNQDPVANGLDQWAPSMAVDSLGNINIIYYDRRLDPFNVMTGVWLSTSFDCGATWTDAPFSVPPPFPVPNPPATTIPPGYIGDYITLDENALNGAGGIWNDSRPTLGSQDVWFEYTKPTCVIQAGDVNGTPPRSLPDVIHLVNYVFDKDRPATACLGSDPGNCWTPVPLCRGEVNGIPPISLPDVIHLVNFVFDKDRPATACLGSDPVNCWIPVRTGECCAP